MIIRRSIAGFVLSALIAGGTLFVVDRQSDEANRTVKEVTERSLDYQREMTKATTDETNAQLEAAKAQLEGVE